MDIFEQFKQQIRANFLTRGKLRRIKNDITTALLGQTCEGGKSFEPAHTSGKLWSPTYLSCQSYSYEYSITIGPFSLLLNQQLIENPDVLSDTV